MKKTFKIFSIATATVMALAMYSCTDFLTIYPTDKVVLEDFWKDKADVDGMVANSYKNLVSDDFVKRVFVYGELRSDDVVETTNIGTELKYINNANLLATNGYCNWSIYYKIINNCNIVLHFAPQVLEEDPDFTQGDLDVVRGEMLAMRALCHFYLVRTFRDVPLLKEAKIDDSQDLNIKQSTPIEALDFILQDLKEAENLVLPSGAYNKETYNKGRFTADAVRAIRADVLLWKAAFTQFQNKSNGAECYDFYTECIDYCERIIADRKQYLVDWKKKNNAGTEDDPIGKDPADALVASYPLETHPINMNTASSHDETYVKIFTDKNNRKESILELQLDENNNHNYAICAFYGYEQGQTSMPFMASSYLGKKGADENCLYKGTTDIRRASFTDQHGPEEDVFPIAKYTTRLTRTGTASADGQAEYYNTNTDDSRRRYYWQNVILYRITDVMLMEAEARALRADSIKNDLPEGFKLVKAVYYRSNKAGKGVARNDSISYSANNASSLQELVLKERQRELCFEGKRWFDLVRMALRDGTTTNMLNIMVPHKYESNQSAIKSKMASIDALFFPIAESVLKTDTALVQNPVYEKIDVISKN
jgi:hypothetical protein